jgi:hypothetical protein
MPQRTVVRMIDVLRNHEKQLYLTVKFALGGPDRNNPPEEQAH